MGKLLIYLFFIISFAFLYFSLINLGEVIYEGNCNQKVTDIYNCIYFSVVTGTTLGFGDLFPNSYWTKFAVIIQVSLAPIFIMSFITSFIRFGVQRTEGEQER